MEYVRRVAHAPSPSARGPQAARLREVQMVGHFGLTLRSNARPELPRPSCHGADACSVSPRTASPASSGEDRARTSIDRLRSGDAASLRTWGGAMGRDGSIDHPRLDSPDRSSRMRGDMSDDYVGASSDVDSYLRMDALARAARAASRRRGEFRWYEFRARRRYRRPEG